MNGEEPILDFKFSRGLSQLQLLQTSDTLTAAVAEALTEKIIAYITGILVIVALIIGVSDLLTYVIVICMVLALINEGYFS